MPITSVIGFFFASVIVSPDATEPRPSGSGITRAFARGSESTGKTMTDTLFFTKNLAKSFLSMYTARKKENHPPGVHSNELQESYFSYSAWF